MTQPRFIVSTLCILLCSHALAQAQDMDKELSSLAEKLASPIKEAGKKKVTVLDFTDLQGAGSELGRYIAEQLTVNLVLAKRDFLVLDRANLKSILAEHKLTATGLVDPENAKNVGMFAGVDALVLGTIIQKHQTISLTAKIITTDTAEIIGAARVEFKSDETVKQLESRPTTEGGTRNIAADQKQDETNVVKSFGDVRIELQPLRTVNGNDFLLSMIVTNRNSKKSVWVALSTGAGGPFAGLKGVVTDSDGSEFLPVVNSISGIATSAFQDGYISQATEIRPNESISPTIKYVSHENRRATLGSCRLQLEFLIGQSFSGTTGIARLQNLVTKIEAQ